MASVNKVILIGNLGADPDMRNLPSGDRVCEFRIATSEQFTDRQGQKQEQTEWHRIVVFGKQAEHCGQYLSKGRSCYVEGRIRTRSWEDKRDGTKRYMTEIVAERVRFLGGGGEGRRAGAPGERRPAPAAAQEPADDFGAPYGGGGSGSGGNGSEPGPGDDEIPF